MATSVYQWMGSKGILCGHSTSATEDEPTKAKRFQQVKEKAAKSKSGLWGPTHSMDSETDPKGGHSPNSQGTDSTKSSSSNEAPNPVEGESSNFVGRVWNNLQCLEDTTYAATTPTNPAAPPTTKSSKWFMDYMDDMCTPCKPRNLDGSFHDLSAEPALGICRMQPPGCGGQPSSTSSRSTPQNNLIGGSNATLEDNASRETPADRRRQRHKQRLLRSPPSPPTEEYEVTTEKVLEQAKLPLQTLTLVKDGDIERSISELTMRSSYGEATAKLAENRRMAYYAVGKHHRQSGRGGNRRCYFTGKLILGGAPFYAGSVQQGLRTLVVFCLPSGIGLPKQVPRDSSVMKSITNKRAGDNASIKSIHSNRRDNVSIGVNAALSKTSTLLSRKASRLSRQYSVDEMSLSVEEELDPNWGLDREYLLSVLPEPKQNLLDEMAKRYPAQFETLPLQVRSSHCWRLYVKFCFFSGLPIAEGEMHYKVRDEIADQYGEEIILSHEVMEAVNGDSAEILRLPNLKTFKYLRKHYNQQSGKLPDEVFARKAWEMVRPEV